jgi:hypothetical protein
MKHNKLKNTGIIFEILCKKIMHETLNPTLPQAAMRIVRRHFTANSKLMTELKLYQQLQDITTIDKAELLGLVTESRMRISSKELQAELDIKFEVLPKKVESRQTENIYRVVD